MVNVLHFRLAPKRLIKKYRHYSAEAAVTEGIPVKRAAKKIAVPVQTLRDSVKGYINPQNFQSGDQTVLTKAEEGTHANYVETMA